MKKFIFPILALSLIVGSSCEEKIDIEKEKEAIMAVMYEESASYYASDFNRFSATYVQDSTFIRMSSSKASYSINSGWDPNRRATIERERELNKEVKTPIKIKIYEETAWVIFNNIGQTGNKSIVTAFLEKDDGNWKMVYRNVLWATSYSQAEAFLINSINYAKSLGKSVEDFASFTADQYKTAWNTTNGYNGIVSNWRSVTPNRELLILEQDDNHIIFSSNNMFPALKNGAQFNVTYDDYLLWNRIAYEKIADYLGYIYTQETTPDGVLVTITKK